MSGGTPVSPHPVLTAAPAPPLPRASRAAVAPGGVAPPAAPLTLALPTPAARTARAQSRVTVASVAGAAGTTRV